MLELKGQTKDGIIKEKKWSSMASVKPPSRQDFFLQETKGGLQAVPLKWYHRIANLLPPWSGVYGSGKVHLLVKNELAKIERLETSAERLKALSQLKVTVETVKDSHRYLKEIGSVANKNFAKVLGDIDQVKLYEEEATGLSLESLLHSIERKDADQEKYNSALKELITKEQATVKTILTENAPLFQKFVKIQADQKEDKICQELINETRRAIFQAKKAEVESLIREADQINPDQLKQATAHVLEGQYESPEKQFRTDAFRGIAYSLNNNGIVTEKLPAPQGLEIDGVKNKYLNELVAQVGSVFTEDEAPWRDLALILATQTPFNAIAMALQGAITRRYADIEDSFPGEASILYIAGVQRNPIELTLVRNEIGKIESISLKTSIWNPMHWCSLDESKEMKAKASRGESFDQSSLVGYIKNDMTMKIQIEAAQGSGQTPTISIRELNVDRKLEVISS